jgi:hypothetical protein
MMMKEGIWKGKKRKQVKAYQRRTRRTCYGELIQIDGSPQDWFEGRRQKCCLIVFIDDATSRLMWFFFAEEETTEAYFTAIEGYLKRYGRPLSLYSDRHTIFRVQIKEAVSGTGEMQFSRAMRELDIELICANSPQAKGLVEKANGTLQDRLIKEMRLKSQRKKSKTNGIITIKTIAHKLARACYYIMRDNVEFDMSKTFNC